jgi:hypothetical protein
MAANTSSPLRPWGVEMASGNSYSLYAMFQLLLVAGLFSIAGFITPAHAQDISLIDTNAFWKYLDAGVDLGTAWRTLDFDDSAWASGPGPLGYGEPFLNTALNTGSGANFLAVEVHQNSAVSTDQSEERRTKPKSVPCPPPGNISGRAEASV